MTHRWLKFWPQDWQRDPALRSCSLAARGLWIEMLCMMHDGDPYGHLTINSKGITSKQLASYVGQPEKETVKLLAELEETGVFSRSDDGLIFSRRMVRDKEVSQKAANEGKNGGNPEIRRGTVPKDERVRPYRRSDSPAKTERIFAKKGGLCWWCDVKLQREAPGEDFFHVDHRVAVCDGGTNDEENLVPSCAACNHDRARVSPTRTGGGGSQQPQGLLSESDRLQTLETEAESEAEKKENRSLRSLPRQAGAAEAFDDFWAAYPRKVGKEAARKAWLTAIKRHAPADIATGLNRQVWNADPQFIPHPATWLNQGRWQDDPGASAPAPQPKLGRLGQLRADLESAFSKLDTSAQVTYDA